MPHQTTPHVVLTKDQLGPRAERQKTMRWACDGARIIPCKRTPGTVHLIQTNGKAAVVTQASGEAFESGHVIPAAALPTTLADHEIRREVDDEGERWSVRNMKRRYEVLRTIGPPDERYPLRVRDAVKSFDDEPEEPIVFTINARQLMELATALGNEAVTLIVSTARSNGYTNGQIGVIAANDEKCRYGFGVLHPYDYSDANAQREINRYQECRDEFAADEAKADRAEDFRLKQDGG